MKDDSRWMTVIRYHSLLSHSDKLLVGTSGASQHNMNNHFVLFPSKRWELRCKLHQITRRSSNLIYEAFIHNNGSNVGLVAILFQQQMPFHTSHYTWTYQLLIWQTLTLSENLLCSIYVCNTRNQQKTSLHCAEAL